MTRRLPRLYAFRRAGYNRLLMRSQSREKLLALGYAYWPPRILHAAFGLGVFQALGNQALTADTLARRLKANPRGLGLLLNALAGMGLLKKKGNQFSNSSATRFFFLPGEEAYIGDFVKLQQSSWEGWSDLEESVRTGKAYRRPPFLENAKQSVRDFTRAMHNTALGHAPVLAKRVSLRGRKYLLDVGGGSGAFSVYFLKANPRLKATVFDLPGTIPFTRQITAKYGLKDRLVFQKGDFLRDPIKGRYDAVFISHIIHGLSEKENRLLMRKIYDALEPGGEILIQDFFLNRNLTAPLFPALFSLNMLLHTPQGRSYSFFEAEEWLRAAGFKKISRLRPVFPRDIRVLKGIKN